MKDDEFTVVYSYKTGLICQIKIKQSINVFLFLGYDYHIQFLAAVLAQLKLTKIALFCQLILANTSRPSDLHLLASQYLYTNSAVDRCLGRMNDLLL
jgi:hypothetical protein